VQTLINAYDDTEEQQAEQAVLDMGYQALPILKDALVKADDAGKAKLQKVMPRLLPRRCPSNNIQRKHPHMPNNRSWTWQRLSVWL